MLYGIIAAFDMRIANEGLANQQIANVQIANETVSESLNPVFNQHPTRTPERPSSTR